jgi:hypothetical protein
VAVVKDAYGNPVPGVSVSFAAPASGASATVAGSPARTGADGQASVTATAGTVAGSYTVTALVAGVTTAARFGLTNAAGAAATVAVASGSGQKATVATRFAAPLVAVAKDAYGNPVPGVSVTFTAPASGASATLTGSPAVTDADGQASVTATAGTVAGSYIVVAAAANVTTAAAFTLTNTEAPSLVVDTILDTTDSTDGKTSLREAIAYANSHPGPDTITFDPAPSDARHWTIRVTGGPLVLTDPATTTIIGLGARLLTLKGEGRSPVFDLRGGSLALSGLTIAGRVRNHGGRLRMIHGHSRNNSARRTGGGLVNRGDTTLTDVTVSDDSASGGGIANNGTLPLTDVIIGGDTARVGSGVFNTRRATLAWLRSPARGADQLGFPSNYRRPQHESHHSEV